jgi:hypothetical protein
MAQKNIHILVPHITPTPKQTLIFVWHGNEFLGRQFQKPRQHDKIFAKWHFPTLFTFDR